MKGIKKTLKGRIAYLRLLAGDTDAFGFFYDEYARKIYSYVYFRTSNKETAEDITHEVFLQTWQYLVDKKQIANLQAYIYRIAHNKIIDFYRAKDRTPQLLDDNQPAKEGNVDQIETGMDLEILKVRIKSLKEEYQEVLILRHLEGLSIEEMGEVLQKDKNTIRVTLHRALVKLKEQYHGQKKNDSQDSQN